jgi:hypothetical protein
MENADKIMALNIEYLAHICGPEMGIAPKICWNESHYEHRMIKDTDYSGYSFRIVIQNILAFKKQTMNSLNG